MSEKQWLARRSCAKAARATMSHDVEHAMDWPQVVPVPDQPLGRGFDPADPTEAALAAWLRSARASQQDPECLVRALRARALVGHAVLEHAATRFARDTERSDADHMLRAAQAVHEVERETWAASLQRAQAEAAAREARARLQAEQGAEERIRAVRQEAEEARARVADSAEMRGTLALLTERVGALASAATTAEVRRLDGELAQARAELDRMRASNRAKGVAGEAAVMDALRGSAAFASWVFADTSTKGGQSDFHMTSPCGTRVVAVEVKNKAVVTLGDVEKSARDIVELSERMGPRLVGYVFASVRTRNVPRKGALRMDRVAGVPVLWFGGEALDVSGACVAPAMDDLVRATSLLLDVGVELQALRMEAAEAAHEQEDQHREAAAATARMFECLNAHLIRLDALRRTAAGLQDAAATIRKHAATLGAEVDAAYREAEAAVCRTATCGTAPPLLPSPRGAASADVVVAGSNVMGSAPWVTGSAPLVMVKGACGREFSSVRAHAAHKTHCDACRAAWAGGSSC